MVLCLQNKLTNIIVQIEGKSPTTNSSFKYQTRGLPTTYFELENQNYLLSTFH